jgi:hypothetical protein
MIKAPQMQLNPTQNGAIVTLMTLPSARICRQYLRYKVAIRMALCDTTRQYLVTSKPIFKCLRLILLRALTAFTLLAASVSHAQDAVKIAPQKTNSTTLDFIELLGELDNDDADGLDAALSEVENKRHAENDTVKPTQLSNTKTEHAKQGAEK